MNKTNAAKRAQVLNCLVEGSSIRATSRLTGVAINTVVKLLADAGRACSIYLSGTSAFHYDIALCKPNGKSTIVFPAGLGGTLTKYRELDNPSDQAAYDQYVNF